MRFRDAVQREQRSRGSAGTRPETRTLGAFPLVARQLLLEPDEREFAVQLLRVVHHVAESGQPRLTTHRKQPRRSIHGTVVVPKVTPCTAGKRVVRVPPDTDEAPRINVAPLEMALSMAS